MFKYCWTLINFNSISEIDQNTSISGPELDVLTLNDAIYNILSLAIFLQIVPITLVLASYCTPWRSFALSCFSSPASPAARLKQSHLPKQTRLSTPPYYLKAPVQLIPLSWRISHINSTWYLSTRPDPGTTTVSFSVTLRMQEATWRVSNSSPTYPRSGSLVDFLSRTAAIFIPTKIQSSPLPSVTSIILALRVRCLAAGSGVTSIMVR